MWPSNTGKPRPNNRVAERLLEQGYVIVSKEEAENYNIKPYGWRPHAEPFELNPGAPGDVLVRVDNNQYAGFKNWANAPGGSFQDAPHDGHAYVRLNGEWVPLSSILSEKL